MNLYSMEADAKGLEIITNLEGIPANVLSCDEGQFEQVLANLVSNAVKYTEKGSITLSTSFGNLQNGALLLEFSLADTGVGIPVHDRERLFNPFNIEGAKTSGKFGGDGLGLPLCKGLVELMGGNIWIEDNEAGQGTVIKFTIRAELEPADNSWRQTIEAEEQTEASLLEDKPSVFGKLDKIYPHRILVVDDDDIHRKIVCAQLKKMGYTADEAADGEEAIAVVMQGNYDLVFMDLRMPNMDGIEASFWIREKFNGSGHMRIIALTGDATVEAREQCMRAGMDNFITKPVQIKDLEAILSHTSHHKQNIQTQLGNTDSVH
jgi:CheY-like chemotaxis protein